MIKRHDASRIANCNSCGAYNYVTADSGPAVPLAEIRVSLLDSAFVTSAPTLCAVCMRNLAQVAALEANRLGRVDTRSAP